MKIVTADQMRRLEQACIPLGVSLDDLMERAGLAKWPAALAPSWAAQQDDE